MTLPNPIRACTFALIGGTMALAGCESPPDPAEANLATQAVARDEPLIEASGTENTSPEVAAQLPLRLGYYSVNTDCSVALKDGNLGIVVEADVWRDIDGDYELLPVEDLGGGKFKLGEAADALRQTGPNSFVVDEGTDYERELRWCAENRPD